MEREKGNLLMDSSHKQQEVLGVTTAVDSLICSLDSQLDPQPWK